jgi:hypothetical protein
MNHHVKCMFSADITVHYSIFIGLQNHDTVKSGVIRFWHKIIFFLKKIREVDVVF